MYTPTLIADREAGFEFLAVKTFRAIYKKVMVILIITMFEWAQQTLPHYCGLGPRPSLYVYTCNMLLKGTSCRRQFGAFCQMFAKQMSP